jgi:hypothetical protein
MKKLIFFLLIFTATGVSMWLSNPDEAKHKKEVLETLTAAIEEEAQQSNNTPLLKQLKEQFSNELTLQIINQAVVVENYKVFSLTKIYLGTEVHTIGLGVFSQVFLVPQVKERIKAEIKKYKDSY